MGLPENEWFIEAPWGRICIVAWGDCCDPPVLLCHGAVDSAACFRPLVQLLPRKYYYIAVELPGNGRSDPYPPGLMVSCYDLVFLLALLVRHFRWESFIFMGHSMGTVIGKLYNLSYPGKISKAINFDPITKGLTVPSDLYSDWYHQHFMKYFENFEAFSKGSENAPQYKWEDAITTLKSNRGLSDEAAAATLERISEPTGNGMIRYTFDQRMKVVVRPPFSPESIQDIFTKKITTPTLSIIAEGSVKIGNYSHTPFKFDEKAWPHGNYRVKRVEGGHDVHFVNPERVAGYVSQFLQFGLEGLDSRAKL